MRTRSQEAGANIPAAAPVPAAAAGTAGSAGTDQPIAPIPLDASMRSISGGSGGPRRASLGGMPPPMTQLTRRSTLHKTNPSLASYRATPITKHYSLNDQILSAFEHQYENKLYNVAYAIGLQFVETALLEIPKHGYFYSTRHTDDRMTNSLNAIRVSSMLRTILEQQQEHPTGDFGLDVSLEYKKVQTLASLAVAQSESANNDQYDGPRARVEAELHEMKKQENLTMLLGDACGPLMESFTETMCPPGGFANLIPTSLSSAASRTAAAAASTASTGQPQPPGIAPIRTTSSGYPQIPGPLDTPIERTVSTMMREMMEHPHAGTGDSGDSKPDPPSLQTMQSSTMVPPPPLLDNGVNSGGWSGMPELDRPEFGRQMSGRTYADHVALERALYLSGLEVQPDKMQQDVSVDRAGSVGHGPHVGGPSGGVIHENRTDDDQWMLEHALKESEREMERLQMVEAQQILEACQQSEKQQQDQALQQYADFHVPAAPQLQRRMTKTRLEIETLHMLYHEDFVSLWNSGRVRVTHVDTYQGKNPGSTNGCTVIAPLLCIHHFFNLSESTSSGRGDDPGLPDETVKVVIDEEVPSILPKVREELGVAKDAFLIPSDAHDYLLQNQFLSQNQFVTVIGGNILDERHLNVLMRTLVDGTPPPPPVEEKEESAGPKVEIVGETKSSEETTNNSSSSEVENNSPSNNSEANASSNDPPPKPRKIRPDAKIACTLFFHEHVVSVLKLRRSNGGKAWYDIIDSLPNKSMLSRELGTSLAAKQDPEPAAPDGPVDEFGFSLSDLEPPMNAARVRCLDEEALSVALKWYACSKFNTENLNYIDAYPWNDNSTDFDPRVFQAFVWTEAD